jgi:hypothetical protein
MRRSKSMSPKVEGLESLVFLSAVVPMGTPDAEVTITPDEPLPSPDGPAHVHESAESGLAPPRDDRPVVVIDPSDFGNGHDGEMYTTVVNPGVDGDVQLISMPPDTQPISAPAPGPGVRPISAPGPEARLIAQQGPGVRPIAGPQGPAARPIGGPAVDLANLDLSSTMRGNYRLQLAPDGSSGSFTIQGIGQVAGLGPARVATNYAADATSAPETMSMSVMTRRGTLTLDIGRHPGDVDPDASTARLRYHVVDATGTLAGARGAGVVDMTLRPQMRTLGTTGQVNLTIRPDLG